MTEEEKNILIDRYLTNDLSDEEREQFEKELKNDAVLQQELDWQKELHYFLGEEDIDVSFKESDINTYSDHFKSKESKALEGALKKTGKEYAHISRSLPKRSVNKRWLSIAASFLLLFGAFWFFTNRSIQSEKLYNQYAQHEIAFTTKGDNDQLLIDAEAAFKLSDYETADDKLNDFLFAHPERDDVGLTLGITKMELNKFDEAQLIFKEVYKNELLRDQAQWNLLLLYLKSGQKNEAKSMIEEIGSSKSHYKTEEVLKIRKRL